MSVGSESSAGSTMSKTSARCNSSRDVQLPVGHSKRACGARMNIPSATAGRTHARRMCRRLPHEDGANKGESGEALESQSPPWKMALFGVLYTLAKEKISDSASIAIASILIDFYLILCLFLTPHYPWAVDPHLV